MGEICSGNPCDEAETYVRHIGVLDRIIQSHCTLAIMGIDSPADVANMSDEHTRLFIRTMTSAQQEQLRKKEEEAVISEKCLNCEGRYIDCALAQPD